MTEKIEKLDAAHLLGFDRLTIRPGTIASEGEILSEAGRMLNKAGTENINRDSSPLVDEAARLFNKVGNEANT